MIFVNHDPWGREYQGEILDRVKGCDAAVVMVAHSVYRKIDPAALKLTLRTPVLVDGRNVIDALAARSAAQTDYRRLRRGYVHIPQQAAFFRADLWRKLEPLDPSFYFAMDYDLWVRIAALAPIQYSPRTWANFRLHTLGKTVAADDRCWPEMLRMHYRDGGSWLGLLPAKYLIRKMVAPLWRYQLRWRIRNRQRSAGETEYNRV